MPGNNVHFEVQRRCPVFMSLCAPSACAFAKLDMELHHHYMAGATSREGGSVLDVQRRVAERFTVVPPLYDDRSLCTASHIFAGGYAAGWATKHAHSEPECGIAAHLSYLFSVRAPARVLFFNTGHFCGAGGLSLSGMFLNCWFVGFALRPPQRCRSNPSVRRRLAVLPRFCRGRRTYCHRRQGRLSSMFFSLLPRPPTVCFPSLLCLRVDRAPTAIFSSHDNSVSGQPRTVCVRGPSHRSHPSRRHR